MNKGLKLRFLLTSRCTATCDYCHNEGQTKKASTLRLGDIKTILQKLAAARIPVREVVLSGGEPTLHKQLVTIAKLCKATGAHVSLDSHIGHPQLLKPVLPFIDELKAHIDSFDPVEQEKSMGIQLAPALESLAVAKQYPNLDVKVNHPLGEVHTTAQFVRQARLLGVNVKVIEMFQYGNTINLTTMNWKALGYSQQPEGHWLHQNGKHTIFHKRCGSHNNQQDNALFIGADGIRHAVDGEVLMDVSAFDFSVLPKPVATYANL